MASKTIQIEVLSVTGPQFVKTARGGYNTLEVAYKNLSFSGKVEGKKIVDFNNPAVFAAVKQLKQGDVVDVTASKGDDDKFWNWSQVGPKFWNWSQVGPKGSAGVPTEGDTETNQDSVAVSGSVNGDSTGNSGVQSKRGRVTGSNWETPEERAQRQVYIVKQSSITAALETLKANGGDISPEEVIKVAQLYLDWVIDGIVPGNLADIKSDIPF